MRLEQPLATTGQKVVDENSLAYFFGMWPSKRGNRFNELLNLTPAQAAT